MIDIIAQICITVFGILAAFLVGSKKGSTRKWGYFCGMCSQPFWFITMIKHQQYFILVLAIFYTVAWIRGYINHRKEKA